MPVTTFRYHSLPWHVKIQIDRLVVDLSAWSGKKDRGKPELAEKDHPVKMFKEKGLQ